MTNAAKGGILAGLNLLATAILSTLVAFNVPLSDAQQAAISGLVYATLNVAALIFLALTYKNSPARIPKYGE